MSDTITLKLNNGHKVGYAEYGTRDGVPIIALHGMPNSHIMWKGMDQVASAHGIRLIAPDRAGYGASNDYLPKSLLDYSDDVSGLADMLGIEKFVIMAVSGGGPYGYACAYKLSDRLLSAVILSSLPPLNILNNTTEMQSMNRLIFNLGRISPFGTSIILSNLLRLSLRSMQKHVQNNTSPSPDISPSLFAILAEDLTEVVRTSRKGISFDLNVYWRAWGFNFEDIKTKVFLWHGEADNLSPAPAAHYIAEHIPNCEAHFCAGEGHVEPLTKHIDEIFEDRARVTFSV
jgi:pimeloyl-ACP methyl ester carboxylesterase